MRSAMRATAAGTRGEAGADMSTGADTSHARSLGQSMNLSSALPYLAVSRLREHEMAPKWITFQSSSMASYPHEGSNAGPVRAQR